MKIIVRLPTVEFGYIEAEFDSMEQFNELYPKIKGSAVQDKSNSEVPFTAKTVTNPGVCPKCGAIMKISSKSGKPYCSALCWKNQ